MRTKSPLVLRPIVALSRSVVNPRQLRRAGRPGAYASIIRHLGRRTGRAYETPVGVVPDGDAFLIVLPYGLRTQWLRNVLAAGEATLVTEGSTYRVDRPEVVPTCEVADRLAGGPARGPPVRDDRLPSPPASQPGGRGRRVGRSSRSNGHAPCAPPSRRRAPRAHS